MRMGVKSDDHIPHDGVSRDTIIGTSERVFEVLHRFVHFGAGVIGIGK